ncbi:23S rRNA (cytidine(2498)-2'-O)-methyltransferase RlmM [Gilvimarinus agarilyticus]|uniref:23S rRNA (cytidine(2498)-2'-O)-methyltransferase RlmM n=1 Tax=unclassified Gilvimarinus TaxID=2642066 RepID=UPI001C08534D|nr:MULTISPECIES: 23S rRNA (cytidine(2498)-2'-O)-methyltransferase RlmM [unclassified Gilvimarinus]MBU2886803.1 23S rRNA (cytidine(2498)-2'-O)-methyltransferase RlmM [Gilvimarinus agarilyticus]MDO6571467.1 23S rRNA (cytidine(2498)-2'-O)-methyltransferase RlmM [Gilvimarinus sp. 2_MG-2023]MDO6747352.1 23S rRNA (cytidine(2498)-2'-O)-methyltransferase RlmM [Gilvimarinus sp. 1_MG-2023]
MNHLYLHCRPGFEKECAAEITELATAAEIFGYSKTKEGQALVTYVTHEQDGALQLLNKLSFKRLIFVRQWFAGPAPVNNMDPTDRLSPLLQALKDLPRPAEWWTETCDTNDGKALSGLAKKFSGPFERALQKNRLLDKKSPWRLHLLFLAGTTALLGVAPLNNSAAWSMGIARLRQPSAAPSRATLKLEEAWHHFIPAEQWEERLAGSMRGVDLGAAPGGWTWQLVKRGMFVEAVDNGPMAQSLMDSGQVTHHAVDGFVFEPKRSVHWLVCDIADKPARVANMIGHWAENLWFEEAVFNLKLPMKQRYAEVKKLEQRLWERLKSLPCKAELSFKQLYHDREEVTGHIRLYR